MASKHRRQQGNSHPLDTTYACARQVVQVPIYKPLLYSSTENTSATIEPNHHSLIVAQHIHSLPAPHTL
jgi:hypothetical protein